MMKEYPGRSYVNVEIDGLTTKALIIGKSRRDNALFYHLLISVIENGREVGTKRLYDIAHDRLSPIQLAFYLPMM